MARKREERRERERERERVALESEIKAQLGGPFYDNMDENEDHLMEDA